MEVNRDMNNLAKELSNPFSTGGGGGNFETRVQAAFVVLMLTGRLSPCLPPWPITKIKLQGRYADFNIDDFIVFASDIETGQEAKLLAQIKHTISITEGNDTFGEVIEAAWRDFNNSSLFTIGLDALALITGPLSANEINNTRSLLEWARHCDNQKEFLNKVNMANFSNDSKRAKLKAFQFHLKKANAGIDVSDEQLWRFLKSFYLIGYDIDTEDGSTISLIQSLIAQTSNENPNLLWARIVCVVQSYNQDAGTLSLENLSKDIRDAFNTKQNPNWISDVRKLVDHSKYIIDGIRTDIGGVSIHRPDYVRQLLDRSEEEAFVLLSGERGCGKSCIVREFAEYMKNRAPVFCLRTEDLDEAHLDRVFSAIGLISSLSELEACFALIPKKYLLIESLEKLLELNHTKAFTDLMQFVRKHPGWTVIASCRDYAFQQISFTFLRTTGVRYSPVFISGFDDCSIQYLCEQLEILQSLATNKSLKPLLSNPFFADLAFRVLESGTQLSSDDGEIEFRAAVWRDVIAKEDERSEGMPLRRKKIFIEIASKRARLMVYGVPETPFDPGALVKLEEDNLIRRDSRGLVSLAHDVLEDWALERYIDETYQANPIDIEVFLNAVGHEPAMNRAFRLWLHQKIRFGEDVTSLVIGIFGSNELSRCWQDETISAILLGPNAFEFLNRLKSELTEGDGELLKRFCFILRIACKEPDQLLTGALSTLCLKPCGLGWEAIIHFIYENRNCIYPKLMQHITAVLYEWTSLIHIEKELPSPAREAGLIALHLLNMVKDAYGDGKDRNKLISIIVKLIPAVLDEFNAMIEADVFKTEDEGKRLPYVKELCEIALTGIETAFLCKYVPETLIRLAFHEWLINESKARRQFYGGFNDVDECFGLHRHSSGADFFPASGLKGPFSSLLHYHPRKGMDFIIRLINLSAEKYACSDLDLPERYSGLSFQDRQSARAKLDVPLNDGTIVKQYSSARLWLAYRGHSVTPYLLQSALMAMENWLIELVDILPANKLEEYFDYILRSTNSVMLTAVLASVATGFPKVIGNAALPLLKTPALYNLDLYRSVQERGGREVDWFNSGLHREPLAEVYSRERREAALRPWRHATLESVIAQLQLSDMREEMLAIIDELRSKVPVTDESWRFRFHRIDSRGWNLIKEKETNQIIVAPSLLEPDLEETQQKTQEDMALTNRFLKLTLWVDKTLKKELLDIDHYASWLDALAEAKSLLTLLKSEPVDVLTQMYYSGIVKTAVICLQDHLAELSDADCSWCAELVKSAVVDNADAADRDIWSEKIDRDGASAAALVLPVLLDKALSDEEKKCVKMIIVKALTHVNQDVRTQAANGIRIYMWQRDHDYAQKCILGSIEYARLKLVYSTREVKKRLHPTPDNSDEEIKSEAWLVDFREHLACAELQVGIPQISFETHNSWHILSPCLMIPDGSTETSHVLILSQVLNLIIEAEASRGRRDEEKMRDIDHELPMNFAKRFSVYFVSLSEQQAQPYIDQLQLGCNTAPDFINWLLLCIAFETEKTGNQEPYWRLWQKLSAKVQKIAIALSKNSDRRSRSDERNKLIRSMLFVDTPWQKVDYENQTIALGKDAILEFVANAGMNTDVFESMASLMYHFPIIFLESGLRILAKHQEETGGTHLVSGNAAFYLERAIQRYLLIDNTQPLSKEMHHNCWVLLDGIIETASSVAYYLREHLMRSCRIENTGVRS